MTPFHNRVSTQISQYPIKFSKTFTLEKFIGSTRCASARCRGGRYEVAILALHRAITKDFLSGDRGQCHYSPKFINFAESRSLDIFLCCIVGTTKQSFFVLHVKPH